MLVGIWLNHVCQERVGITLAGLTMDILCRERAGITLTGLTMEIYMSREGWYHTALHSYVKEGLNPINRLSHIYIYQEKTAIPLTSHIIILKHLVGSMNRGQDSQ